MNYLLSLLLSVNLLNLSTPESGGVKQPIYSPSTAQVFKLYNKLRKYSGQVTAVPSLTIIDSEDVNAYARSDTISITTGMIKFVHSEDELAAVLGHEIGHELLGHLEDKLTDDVRLHEANADKFGLYLMMRAGYNPCAIAPFWARLAEEDGDDMATSGHPSDIQRAYEMQFPMCGVSK